MRISKYAFELRKLRKRSFCLTLSWKEDIDARVIDVYHKISYGKEYCSKIEGSKWNEILKLRESGLKDSEIIEKSARRK